MNDYFQFLESLKVDDEVLTTASADRIYKVIGISGNKIAVSSGNIFDKETGEIFRPKKNDPFVALLPLTPENKKRIEADTERRNKKEAEQQEHRLITNEYDELVGIAYRAQKPSIENQKKIIAFIKKLPNS